ncbi:unnamed protein product [Moneuplotes crassus]|uniref:Acyl carrier protein n=1 Tax=Euplotes crassus TaxID=5936 RepID=A0AAD2D6K2_EUPCR|nr:unnamed protein product [Moneuplotes crassus]
MFSRATTTLLKGSVSRAFPKTLPKTLPKSALLFKTAQRSIYSELGYESHSIQEFKGNKSTGAIELWREYEDESNALTLKDHDEISDYVLKISRDYFRTTKKATLELESSYRDHGLDSLDVIELIIQVEDDLGYVIDAENLEKFQKPKHFVNFIKQIEAYKEEFGKLPHEGTKATFSMDTIKSLFQGDKH